MARATSAITQYIDYEEFCSGRPTYRMKTVGILPTLAETGGKRVCTPFGAS